MEGPKGPLRHWLVNCVQQSEHTRSVKSFLVFLPSVQSWSSATVVGPVSRCSWSSCSCLVWTSNRLMLRYNCCCTLAWTAWSELPCSIRLRRPISLANPAT